MTQEEFIQRSKEIHENKYDYSKVNYINNKTKVIIICPIHGEFEQFPSEHLKGSECRKCSLIKRTSTTEEFIQKARKAHGDKYDYSKVNYVSSITKVIIICPEHGEFQQLPSQHLRGHGCPMCVGYEVGKRLTQEEFIERARKIHGDKYDYNRVNYVNAHTPVTIICPTHGEFQQEPCDHLKGGCRKCAFDNLRMTQEEFIRRAREIHGDRYDYSKVNYINSNTKVTIICPVHGEFQQTPIDHLVGKGCRQCYFQSRRMTTEEFIRKAKEIHGDRYDYSKTVYINARTKVTIICPEHGEFVQSPRCHLQGKGCPSCNTYKLENATRKFLKENNIQFSEQKTWDWLRFKVNQRVDFYLPDYGIAIECQGKQHFEPVDWFDGQKGFEECLERDKNKLDLCTSHKIKIVYYSNLSTGTRSYPYPYKVYEDLEELFNNEVRLTT